MNSDHICLSVVMSTYNDERYIRDSIESILNQTYPYFEFIIVNDGSTDSTKEIIESYKDSRIVLVNKPNTGLIDSLNIGIAKAKYEWIARMDGDDIADKDRFKKQVPYIEQGYDVIGGAVHFMNYDGTLLNIGYPPQARKKINFMFKIGVTPFFHPTMVINKQKLLQVGGYDSNMYCAEDKDLWLMLSSTCRMVNSHDVVLKYRLNPNGISISRKEIQFTNGLVAYTKYLSGFCHTLTKEEYDNLLSRVKGHSLYKQILKIDAIKTKYVIQKKMKQFVKMALYNYIAKTSKLKYSK